MVAKNMPASSSKAGSAPTTPMARIALSPGNAGSSGSSVVACTEQRADLFQLHLRGRPGGQRSQHQLERGRLEPERRAPARCDRLTRCHAPGEPGGLAQEDRKSVV